MITPEAITRDELIEAIADALRNAQLNTFSNQAAIALTAIEAQGLVILPVEAIDDQEDAMLDTGLVEDGVPGKSASDCAQIVYRAMIKAGKL